MAEYGGLRIPDLPVFDRVAINLPRKDHFSLSRGGMAALCENLVIIPEKVHEAYGWHLIEEQGLPTENVKPVVAENSFIWFLESLITGMVLADFKRSYTVWYHLIKAQNESGIALVLSFEPQYSNGTAIPRAVYDQLSCEFPVGERCADHFRDGATPLIQWQPPNTVMSFWQDDFVIPDFSAIAFRSSMLIEPAAQVASWEDQTVNLKGKVFNICYRHFDLSDNTATTF